VPRKSNRQDSSHAGVSWLSRERGEVTNRCRCSSRHRCRAVGYLALWVLGVAGYLASLHGGADLDVRVDGHLDVPISYLSLGELRWLPRLAYTVVQFERWNTAGRLRDFILLQSLEDTRRTPYRRRPRRTFSRGFSSCHFTWARQSYMVHHRACGDLTEIQIAIWSPDETQYCSVRSWQNTNAYQTLLPPPSTQAERGAISTSTSTSVCFE
jgi:hypothetical protein